MKYLLIIALFFAGCSKVYQPKTTQTKRLKSKTIFKNLDEYTKKHLTFSTLSLKYEKHKRGLLDDGIEVVKVYFDENGRKIGKFKKINDDLAIRGDKLYVISQKRVYTLPYLIFSATKKGNLVAVVFENGKYGIYDLQKREMAYMYDSDPSISVKYLHAQPLFYEDLILFPLVTGNVAVVDKNGKFIRTLNISANDFNDNVIFLKIVNSQLFMATPSKLVLFNPSYLIDYKANIKHIIDMDGYIYIFTVEGDIIKLNSSLKVIKKITLPYASFFAPSVCNGNIWTVEKEGYLIKITPQLKVTVYNGNDFDTKTDGMLKLKGCKIYNDNKVFMIE